MLCLNSISSTFTMLYLSSLDSLLKIMSSNRHGWTASESQFAAFALSNPNVQLHQFAGHLDRNDVPVCNPFFEMAVERVLPAYVRQMGMILPVLSNAGMVPFVKHNGLAERVTGFASSTLD